MKKEIKQNWFFEHSPDKVWDYLTIPDLMAQWLMPNNFKPIVGHHFQFKSAPDEHCIYDGIAYCEVLEVVPMKRVSYTWDTGPGNGKITVNSIVTWTLDSRNNGTELELRHTGFKEVKDYDAHNEGWTKLGQRFVNRLNEVFQNETTNT